MSKGKSIASSKKISTPATLNPKGTKVQGKWVAKTNRSATQFFDISKQDDLETVADSTDDSDAVVSNEPVQNGSSTDYDTDDTCTGSGSSCVGDEEATSEEETVFVGDSLRNKCVASTTQAQKLKALSLWSECKAEKINKEQPCPKLQCQEVAKPRASRTPLSLVMNNAAAFVPSWGQPAPMQNRQLSDGETMLQRTVGAAFDAQSWELHLPREVEPEVTNVDVVLNVPKQAPLHMMQASLKLLEAALLKEGDNIEMHEVDLDNLHLRFSFMSTPLKECCMEFGHWGRCPRTGCHWPHCTSEHFSVSMWLDCDKQGPLQVGGTIVFKEADTSPSSQMCSQVSAFPSLFWQVQPDPQSMQMMDNIMQAEWMCSGGMVTYEDGQQQQQVYDEWMISNYDAYEVHQQQAEVQQPERLQGPPKAQQEAPQEVDSAMKPKLPATPPGVFTAPSRPPGVFFSKEECKMVPALRVKSDLEPCKVDQSADLLQRFSEVSAAFRRLRTRAEPEGMHAPSSSNSDQPPKEPVGAEKTEFLNDRKLVLDIAEAWRQASWADLSEGYDELALP